MAFFMQYKFQPLSNVLILIVRKLSEMELMEKFMYIQGRWKLLETGWARPKTIPTDGWIGN